MSICFILSGHMGERGEKKREQTVLRPGDVALNASFCSEDRTSLSLLHQKSRLSAQRAVVSTGRGRIPYFD